MAGRLRGDPECVLAGVADEGDHVALIGGDGDRLGGLVDQ